VFYHRTMKATLLLVCVLIVYLDCTQDTKAKKPKKMCKKPKGKPGTVIFKGCLKYQCIKKKNKYFWKKTIAEENCCVFKNTGFPVGSTILSEKSSEDGFSVASVKCELIGGMPEPVIDIENVCPVCTTPNGEVPVEMSISLTSTTTTPPITGHQIVDSQSVGGEGGGPWSDVSYHSLGNINTIKVRHARLLDNIQIQYGITWAPSHGGGGGNLTTISLNGDKITEVYGRKGSVIDAIGFITEDGTNYGPYGRDGGSSFHIKSPKPGCYLKYFSGRSGRYVDSLTFHWKCFY